jgi:uncharacterized protein YndB with AHSA1/START domain
MHNILHKVGVRSSARDAFERLSTLDGLAGWWASDTTGDCTPGGTIHFRFGDRGKIDVKVLEQDPERRVLWQVVDGPGQWLGTKLSFELKPDGDYTSILFQHRGWKEQSEAMHHCSTKWAMFLMSLKALIETGKGSAYPNDVHVAGGGD